jgi:hypothetical protein
VPATPCFPEALEDRTTELELVPDTVAWVNVPVEAELTEIEDDAVPLIVAGVYVPVEEDLTEIEDDAVPVIVGGVNVPEPEEFKPILLLPVPVKEIIEVAKIIDDTTLDNTLLETVSRFILFALVSKGLLNIQASFISG